MIGGRGPRGNREVSPLPLLSMRGDLSGARAEAAPKEGGSWGKHGFTHGSEPKASDDHPRSREKTTSVEPSVTVSPSRSFARFTRLPFTSIPFVEPRSTIQ